MLRLVPIRGQSKPIPLSSEKVTIGRSPDNTIPLLDERASRNHCVIESDGNGGWIVRDLGSRNGTKVNEERIMGTRPLRPGDVVRVGQHEFLVEGQTAAVQPSFKPDQHVDAALEGIGEEQSLSRGVRAARTWPG